MDGGSLLSRSQNKSVSSANPNIISLEAYDQIFASTTPLLSTLPRQNSNIHLSLALEQSGSQLRSMHPSEPLITSPAPQPTQPQLPCPKVRVLHFPKARILKQMGVQTLRPSFYTTSAQTELLSQFLDTQLLRLENKEKSLDKVQHTIDIELKTLNEIRENISQEKKDIQRERQKFIQTEKNLKIKVSKLEKQLKEFQMLRTSSFIKKIDKVYNRTQLVAFMKILEKSEDRFVQKKVSLFYEKTFKQQPLVPAASKEKAKGSNLQLQLSFKDQISFTPAAPLIPQQVNLSSRVPRKRVIEVADQQFTKLVKETLKHQFRTSLDLKGINYPLNYKR